MGSTKDADSIVSFNKDSFESYGHSQGYNSPVGESSAFKYVAALNRFLERDSGHRIQIGDASVVFWAEATDTRSAADAEDIFAQLFEVDEHAEAKKIGAILAKIRSGRPLGEIRPDLTETRFFILALSPNAARLSVRFYLEDTFGEIANRYVAHLERMRIDPPPKEEAPSTWRLLIETAVQRKSDNIIPNLAGEWMRAILTGSPYPLTLLAALNMRIRADHDVNALRAAIIKSVLIRNFRMEVNVSLDPENREPGYLLGRLFAAYERIQSAALGQNVNATIKDKFYSAASTQPRKVFPLLERGSKSHLSKLGKETRGYQIKLEKTVADIMDAMLPAGDPFPSHLPERQQGLFALGYYHQRNYFFTRTSKAPAEEGLS
jgi:CRISPR-associated protein Csd1